MIAVDKKIINEKLDLVIAKLMNLDAPDDAMDKETSYTERAQAILNDSVVLRLSPDGNELFGRSWNKKTKEDE